MVKMGYLYDIDDVSLLLLRMAFALPFYTFIWIRNKKEWSQKPLTGKQIGLVIFLGFVGYYLASFFDFRGLTYIDASLERLILFAYPTIVLVLSALFLKQKITGQQIIAILVTYIGLAIIFLSSGGITDVASEDLFIGATFIALCAISYAFYLVGANYLIPSIGSKRVTTISLTVSCFSVLIHYFLVQPSFNIFSFPWQVYVISFCMAILATVIPSFLINEAIARLGAPTVSIIGSLGPVSTIVLSMIFLGESLTLIQFGGALVIICGVGIISYSKTGTQ